MVEISDEFGDVRQPADRETAESHDTAPVVASGAGGVDDAVALPSRRGFARGRLDRLTQARWIVLCRNRLPGVSAGVA